MKSLFFDTSTKKVVAKKRIRKNQILKYLRDNEFLSYAQIARRTKFSLPMVADLIRELQQEKFVIPAETPELKVGRPPNTVRLNPEAAYIIGVDIGRTATNLIVINLKQEIVSDLIMPVVNLKNQDKLIENLEDEIDQIIKKAKIKRDKVIGIGVAIPGLVNHYIGKSFTYLNSTNIVISDLLEERLNTHVVVENDAKAMALGELYFGMITKEDYAIVLNLGWGIGSGIVLKGDVFRGKSGFAGEIGHIIVEENGPLCSCGKHGCLEEKASGRVIGHIAKRLLEDGAQSQILSEYANKLDQVNPEVVIDYALNGDHFSIDLIEQSGYYIGKCLGYLINTLNPNKIILGGRGSRAGNLLLNKINSSITRHSLVDMNRDVEIHISKLGHNAGSLGATTLITRQIFETSHLDIERFV